MKKIKRPKRAMSWSEILTKIQYYVEKNSPKNKKIEKD